MSEAGIVPEKRHSAPVTLAKRMAGLQRAATYMGQEALAKRLRIAPRTLRAYIAAERGITDDILDGAAQALIEHAREIELFAARLIDLTA